MFGSIFVGLSGMRAFSSGLKQISNNITNINSTGFKTSGLSFTDLFGADGARAGQGVSIDAPRLEFTQGELRQSQRDLDLAIDGGGFLVLLKDAERHFARTGNFEVNEDGDIVLSGTDYKLTVLDASGNPSALSVAAHRTNPPEKTTRVTFSGNLTTGLTTFSLSNIQVFDETGAVETWGVKFDQVANTPGEWTVTPIATGFNDQNRQTLRFLGGKPVPATAQLTFTSGSRSVVFDFSKNVDSFSSGTVSTLRVEDVDGFAAGEITTLKVNDAGMLEITYSNEQKLALGAVTVASFDNDQDLEQRGSGLFTHNGASSVEFLTSAHDKVGRVMSGRLEASNVDLSQEFGDLILVQRGFQASSQVVSASNDMIQQLFGIRGQG